MDESHDTVIVGRTGEYRAPENFCRAVFLQIASRVARRGGGQPGKELAKFFSNQAEKAMDSRAGFDLWRPWPDGADFANENRRRLLMDAFEEIIASLEISQEQPENWNACSRWRDWGVVKARELMSFLRAEAESDPRSGPPMP